MAEPAMPQTKPYVLEMEPGEYWWCACGRSRKQPFCDGSHKETPFKPMQHVLDKKQMVAWCGCKRTKTPPRCDGSHNEL